MHFNELNVVLRDLGYEVVSTRGSHWKFKNKQLKDSLIIPVHNNIVKKSYIRKIILKIIINSNETL